VLVAPIQTPQWETLLRRVVSWHWLFIKCCLGPASQKTLSQVLRQHNWRLLGPQQLVFVDQAGVRLLVNAAFAGRWPDVQSATVASALVDWRQAKACFLSGVDGTPVDVMPIASFWTYLSDRIRQPSHLDVFTKNRSPTRSLVSLRAKGEVSTVPW